MQPHVLVQRDPPLRPVAHVVGDAGGPAPRPVVAPRLRQIQVGIDQRLKPTPSDPHVHRDDAVVDLGPISVMRKKNKFRLRIDKVSD